MHSSTDRALTAVPGPTSAYRAPMGYASTKALVARLDAEPLAWSSATLIAHYSETTLYTALRSGRIVRILPETYVGKRWKSDFGARVSAASSWCGTRAAVTGLAAAYLYGWFPVPPARIEIMCAHKERLRTPYWLTVRRTLAGAGNEVRSGVRIATRAQVIVRCWETIPAARATSFVIDALRDREVTPEDVLTLVSGRSRVKRRQELLSLLALIATGVESYLEYVAATEVFVGPHFKEFIRQGEFRVDGTRYRVDMLHKAARVAVELDGARFHADDKSRRRDIERDSVLASHGVLTLRFTYEDITRRPQWCRNRVLQTVRARMAGPPRAPTH